jgi:hypothetical protein
MMARVYLDAAEAATLGIMQHLPRVIQGTMQQIREAEAAETSFYKAWPQLDPEKHRPVVLKLAQTFRQANPNATAEDFTRFVGAQAMVALGLHVQPAPAVVPAATVPQGQQPAQPFRPIGASAPATAPHGAEPKNIYAAFADEDLTYDKGD